MNWERFRERLARQSSQAIGELEGGALRDALATADWLIAMADETGLVFDDLPAPTLDPRYHRQLELLVQRHQDQPTVEIWGAIQRLLYESYGLSCDEIARVQIWRQQKKSPHP